MFGFGRKKDYAKEFKDAFENTNVNKMIQITKEWQKKDPSDKNCALAVCILALFSDDIDAEHVKVLYLTSKKSTPVNKELASFFELTAMIMFKTKGIDIEL